MHTHDLHTMFCIVVGTTYRSTHTTCSCTTNFVINVDWLRKHLLLRFFVAHCEYGDKWGPFPFSLLHLNRSHFVCVCVSGWNKQTRAHTNIGGESTALISNPICCCFLFCWIVHERGMVIICDYIKQPPSYNDNNHPATTTTGRWGVFRWRNVCVICFFSFTVGLWNWVAHGSISHAQAY